MITIGRCVLSPWREILQNSSARAWQCTGLWQLFFHLSWHYQKKFRNMTQYQFKVFKNVNCYMSLRRRHLDKAGTLLFC